MGDRARRRVLREHTYAHRAEQVEAVLEGRWTPRAAAVARGGFGAAAPVAAAEPLEEAAGA